MRGIPAGWVHRCAAGLIAGFAAHQALPLLERYVPRRRGLFPLACYTVGGLVLIAVSALLYGPRQAARVALALALVGIGVSAGWVADDIWRAS
ncbi:MAG TPA: hypothetical protein ENJ31_13560 [Anaerolineae bacterium]|nr:hypothetical protein [Anaerolineae bacterium]